MNRKLNLAAALLALAVSPVVSAQSIQVVGDVWDNVTLAPATPASPWNPSVLQLGKVGGNGAVYVRQGGTINTSSFTVVGFASNFSGLLRVSDFGSTLNTSALFVGNGGQGRLEILDGGRVSASTLDLAYAGATSPGTTGSVLVSGAGSTLRLRNSGSTIASRDDFVGTLSVENGGLADIVGVLNVAFNNDASEAGTGTIHVNGIGSTLRIADTLNLGQAAYGSGTLNVGAGASVRAGALQIGRTGTIHLNGGDVGSMGGLVGLGGTISGHGTVSGLISTYASGSMKVAAGRELRLVAEASNHQLINRGLIENFGGTFTMLMPGSNQVGGQIVGRDASFNFGERTAATAFVNIGQIAFVGGANNVVGPVTNSAKMLADGNSTVTFQSNFANSGEFKVLPGSRAIFLGTLTGNGVIGGGAVTAMSLVAPAGLGAAGNMQFNGPVTIDGSAGELAIDFGTQADSLSTTGRASVDGKLSLSLLNGTPAMYVGRRVLSASTLEGRFDRITGTLPAAGVGLAVQYDATGITVTAALPGDANVNGTVNFADLVTLAQNYNRTTGQQWQTGDFSGDGAVNFADLVVLAQHYNRSLAADGAMITDAGNGFAADLALVQALVPEPTTLGTLAAIGTLAMRRRR